MADGQAAVAEHGERIRAELPERRGELLLAWAQRSRRTRRFGQVGLVQIPPPGPVRDHVQAALVPPDRSQYGLPVAAHDHPLPPLADRGYPQLGPVPRHPRVIPADPGQRGAVRRRGREGVEVRTADQHPDRAGVVGGRAVQRHGYDRPGDPAARVPLPDAPHLVGAGGEHEVGEPVGGRLAGRRRQRLRLFPCPARRPAAIQPLVGEVREQEAIGQRQVGAAAVLMHPRPGVPGHREQVTADAVRSLADHGHPPALGRPGLLPPHLHAGDDREREADPLARDVGALDGGGPFPVDVRFCNHLPTDIPRQTASAWLT